MSHTLYVRHHRQRIEKHGRVDPLQNVATPLTAIPLVTHEIGRVDVSAGNFLAQREFSPDRKLVADLPDGILFLHWERSNKGFGRSHRMIDSDEPQRITKITSYPQP